MTQHKALLQWVNEMAALCGARRTVWVDGSEEQRQELIAQAIELREVIALNPKKHPGCLYHRTAVNDVARAEQYTYICCPQKDDAGPTNRWIQPDEAYAEARGFFGGSMRRRTMPDGSHRTGTMYVIPFSMGPVGSPFSKIGVELTDSIYVVLNMLIMCRCGDPVLKALGTNGEFTKGLHARAEIDKDKQRILHFPQDNTIWSVNSGYGGNVLLGKKCLSLRIASCLAREEGWLAEHMLILGVQYPDGHVDYLAGAFPSACGKTNLAMLVPPKALAKGGYKVWTLGDDIAWMRIKEDGRLWAINPETGFFGVAPGTNSCTNPNAMTTIARNTIYTNTVLSRKDRTVWWEGHDDPPPARCSDWAGEPWNRKKTGNPNDSERPGATRGGKHYLFGAHPNSRFTAPARQCPSLAPNWEDPEGVPISAIIFGSRRARLTPLVWESFDWQHGVYLGANMTSEITHAQSEKVGEIRRDPMAMRPFCGYNMADYFRHWLAIGKKLTHPPRIFRTNWFRRDADEEFLWPGFGENLRILLWILDRCRGNAAAIETPIGYVPTHKSIDWSGLEYPRSLFTELHAINHDDWLAEDEENEGFLRQFGDRLPQELLDEHAARERRLRGRG